MSATSRRVIGLAPDFWPALLIVPSSGAMVPALGRYIDAARRTSGAGYRRRPRRGKGHCARTRSCRMSRRSELPLVCESRERRRIFSEIRRRVVIHCDATSGTSEFKRNALPTPQRGRAASMYLPSAGTIAPELGTINRAGQKSGARPIRRHVWRSQTHQNLGAGHATGVQSAPHLSRHAAFFSGRL